jgi:hypothetical protein
MITVDRNFEDETMDGGDDGGSNFTKMLHASPKKAYTRRFTN